MGPGTAEDSAEDRKDLGTQLAGAEQAGAAFRGGGPGRTVVMAVLMPASRPPARAPAYRKFGCHWYP